MDVLRWLLEFHDLDHLPGCAWDGVQLVDLLDLDELDADECSNNCSYRSCNNDYRVAMAAFLFTWSSWHTLLSYSFV